MVIMATVYNLQVGPVHWLSGVETEKTRHIMSDFQLSCLYHSNLFAGSKPCNRQ